MIPKINVLPLTKILSILKDSAGFNEKQTPIPNPKVNLDFLKPKKAILRFLSGLNIKKSQN